MKRLALLLAQLAAGCGTSFISRNAEAGAACEAAGGFCVFAGCPDGGPRDFAGIDCNPDRNPGWSGVLPEVSARQRAASMTSSSRPKFDSECVARIGVPAS